MVTKITSLPFSVVVLTVDYDEAPDLTELNPFMEEMVHPVFHCYDDGSSTVLWLIAERALSVDEQSVAYEAYQEE